MTLKKRLMESLVLTRPNFSQSFILDVDWSIKGVWAILSQKLEKKEEVITYASKGLFPVQKRFHPMEGKCHALV